MKIARKVKLTSILFLLWALPLSTLPRVAANSSTPKQLTNPATTSKKSSKKADDTNLKLNADHDFAKLPLSFEPNQGQTNERVKFLSRGKGYTVFLTPTETVLSLRRNTKTTAQRMKLVGANANTQIEGQQLLPGKINYLIGNDRSRWTTNIPTFEKVLYSEVWPGVDMLWYGTQSSLEYDFVIKPGSDPSRIKLSFAGAGKLRLNREGDLVVKSAGEEVKHSAPVIYQETEAGRAMISGKYVIKGNHEVGFEVGAYDTTKPLVIDPILIYSSYIGGNSFDEGHAVSVDGQGQAYIAGESSSSETTFPLRNPIQGTQIGTLAFITKLNAAGNNLVYSTFLGDATGFCTLDVCGTEVRGIAVSSDGKAAITGATVNDNNESKFPLTDNAFQKSGFCIGVCGLEPDRRVDAFVTVLSADGQQLIYSTFFGGSASASGFGGRAFDAGNAIALDIFNHVYIAGQTASNNLPTKHAFQWSRHSEFNGFDAFLAVFNPLASNGNDTLLYSSYIGGDKDDIGKGIAVDPDRNAYIVGSTESADFETKSPSAAQPLQSSFQGGTTDGFIAKVDTEADGNASLTYSTYFGGSINDRVQSVAVDAQQRAYITGASNSSPSSFPLKNAFDSTQTNGEAFVAKLNADGTALFYCSFLGGDNANTTNDGEEGLGLVIDFGGNVYVTGRTTSGGSFPSLLPLPANQQGTAFLTKIEATISSTTVPRLLYSTTFGGPGAKAEAIALDRRGNVYLAGTTTDGLTTTVGAFDTTFNGAPNDAFVAKFNSTFDDTVGIFRQSLVQFQLRDSNTTGPADHLVTFGQAGDVPVAGDWDNTGVDRPGVYRSSTGQFILQISPRSVITINFGTPGGVDVPVVGDWDGNGVDTPGVFNPQTNNWFLTNGVNGQNINNSFPPAAFQFFLGQVGDLPVAGDWNGDGFDTVGVFRTGTSQWFLTNGFLGVVDFKPFVFGSPGSLPIAGDWNGDGVDTIGVFTPKLGLMSLNNVIGAGNGVGDIVFNFGQLGDLPVAGDWDGKPSLP